MTYATVEDVIARVGADFIQTLLPEPPDDETPADTARVDLALKDASDEINLYLSRYTLPLDPVPTMVRGLCVDLALVRLPVDGAGDNDILQARAKTARKLLEGLADGSLKLPGIDDNARDINDGGVWFEGRDAIFGDADLRGM